MQKKILLELVDNKLSGDSFKMSSEFIVVQNNPERKGERENGTLLLNARKIPLLKVLPLKENLQKTDWFIDQIVERLYVLTDEEIKIVEGHKQSKWDSDC